MSANVEDQSPASTEPILVAPAVDEGQSSEPPKPEFRVYRPPQSTSATLRTLDNSSIDFDKSLTSILLSNR